MHHLHQMLNNQVKKFHIVILMMNTVQLQVTFIDLQLHLS